MTTEPAKIVASPSTVLKKAQANTKLNTASNAPHATEAKRVTLEELAREMKVSPRDARMLLRLAAKQTRLYPTLGKEHVARQPWSWATGSKALEEARKALASSQV